MKVSRSGFYDYLHSFTNGSDDSPEEAALKSRTIAIFKEHRGKYGSRRISKQLKAEGYPVGRYKARRLMRELGLKAKAPKRYKITTDSRHSFPIAPNILDRKFNVDQPNTTWTTDITYVWTLSGWLYLAVVLDLYSRQIVGWAMNKRMKKQLTIDALAMAYWRRKPATAGLGSSYYFMMFFNDARHPCPPLCHRRFFWRNWSEPCCSFGSVDCPAAGSGNSV